ncbi:MAG: DUF4065 domain-containing protein [Paludibacteraceae bacterium]|nr:DUF4065 domain-containing protein [Paludibacteraceae bacterium]
MEFTSIDYANYIRYLAADKYYTSLNNTQVNKMLFICYGLYLVIADGKLFNDDTPKAWPFGPVFPRVYKRFDEYSGASQTIIDYINANEQIKELTSFVVDKFYSWSAYQLSEWSHQPDGPWYQTVYGDGTQQPKWNREIPDEVIKQYFTPTKQ